MEQFAKFRVWDGKHMHYSDKKGITISFDEQGWIAGAVNFYKQKKLIAKEGNGAIMQYSGLLDDFVEPIYAGDIRSGNGMDIIVLGIGWCDNGQYGWTFQSMSTIYPFGKSLIFNTTLMGNIYENKELIPSWFYDLKK